jgi:predicted RNA polymerase sigma factor
MIHPVSLLWLTAYPGGPNHPERSVALLVLRLEIVDGLAAEPALAGYHYLPSVRGDLLTRLGRHDEAAAEFRRAAALTRNIPERTLLLQRAAECDAPT